jgi:transposase
MAGLPTLTVAQMACVERFFPRACGLRRVDDRRVVPGIVYVIRRSLQWKDAPAGYGPHKTLYNGFVRRSQAGVFNRIVAGLAAVRSSS